MDRGEADEWIRTNVDVTGDIALEHDRPWATVLRVPVDGGNVWFKACGSVQTFEARLSADLFARSPSVVAEVLAYDEERAWLLLADAGTPIAGYNNPPEAWETVLPVYAELQRRETAHAREHLAHGVPDLRVATLPARFDELLHESLPLEPAERERLRTFAPRFAELCAELDARGIAPTIQHDDLHFNNVYADGERMRVLDWGDSCVSHPFASLIVTFEHLEFMPGLSPDDPWFPRLRDAYLEPWGSGLVDTFELAYRVGTFAHDLAWIRQRDHLPPDEVPEFDEAFRRLFLRTLAQIDE